MSGRLLVIIPAWNEQKNIVSTLNSLKASTIECDVVVVDDGSTDETGAFARNVGATVLTLPFNLGVGGAMRTGFVYAQRNDYDFAIQFDADGQHLASEIASLLEGLQRSDIVIGSRFLENKNYRVRGPRAWAMKLLAASLSRTARTRLTDVTSGFRAANRKAIDQYVRFYPVEYLGDTVESLVAALRSGLTVSEVAVEMRTRQAGEPSHNTFRSSLQFVRSLFALGVAFTRNPEVRQT